MFIQDRMPLSISSSGITAKVKLCRMSKVGMIDTPGPSAFPLFSGVVKRDVLTTMRKGTCTVVEAHALCAIGVTGALQYACVL
jgi:hypothetical protein